MANEDIVKLKGVTGEYKDTRGGAATIPSAVLGIVKNNVDPTHSGRLEVYLKRMGSSDPDNKSNWTTVRYLSPFFGYTPNTGNPDGHGDYVGNPNSYGFWATPPDIGTEVICIFLNGDASEGYYIGCVPQPGLTQMVPAIGAVDNVIPNSGEAQSYGGATRLPVGESNSANDKQANAPRQSDNPRPVHSYQAAIYNKQGLLRDPDRGPVSSSSMRESPSRVFGISTPGRPIFQGGYTDETIKSATSSTASTKNFQVIGRVGGHTFVMDDGDLTGKDQLVRLRSSAGHTILMNDSAQTLFIIHANGQSYIELGKEGTIDMYSTNSVNIRTQGDLNFHADRDINMFAAKNFNLNAENVQIESEKQTNQFSGTGFAQYVKGDHTTKVDGGMSMYSTGDASLASSGTTYVNGPSAVNLNTGSSGLSPQKVKQVAKVKHTDTLYDEQKGFAAAPGKLTSITSRAPAHSPWSDANKGVDAKTNLSASSNYPSSAKPVVDKVNGSAGNNVSTPTTPSLVSTVPNSGKGTRTLTPQQTNAVASAMAVNAATNNATAASVQNNLGLVGVNGTPTAVLGNYAATPTQLVSAGYLKPGADVAVNNAIRNGIPIDQAIPPSAWTGKNGVNKTEDFIYNTAVQSDAATTLISKSERALIDKGALTGKESGTQSAGLILAGASAGVGPVNDYMKTVANDSSSVTKSVSSSLPQGTLNPTSGPVSNLIAGGILAASIAEKSMSGLTTSVNSLEGVSKGLFDSIVSAFKPLTAGVPQNLSSINAENKTDQVTTNSATPEVTPQQAAEAASTSKGASTTTSVSVSDALNKAFTAGNKVLAAAEVLGSKLLSSLESSMNHSGVDNLPGGSQSVSSVVNGNNPQAVPGTNNISNTISTVSADTSSSVNTTNSATSGLKNQVTNIGLANFASVGLPASQLAILQSAINSISAGGSAEVKLPTTAENTNDTSALASQSQTLLGNPKIPPIKI